MAKGACGALGAVPAVLSAGGGCAGLGWAGPTRFALRTCPHPCSLFTHVSSWAAPLPRGPAEMCPHSHPTAGCLLPSLPARSPLPTLQALCWAGSLITGLI